MTKKTVLAGLTWIIPLGLGLGALLSAMGSGIWWIGWLAYSFVLLLGLSALAALWRWACAEQDRSTGSSRTLGVMLLAAFVLRLGLGVALTRALPAYGYGREEEKAGYVFPDAYTRDTQAWQLADSSIPIWKAFDKSYSTDQYGGLLAFSALVYRYLSPDAHRPWLIVLLAALAAAIGVVLAWKAAHRLWGETVAVPAAWVMALFPESVLLGASQMREPFLITFAAMLFWGVVDWQSNRHWQGWAWVAGSLAGMLLVSPGMVVFALLGVGVWAWLRSTDRRIPWRLILIVLVVLALALVLLTLGVARGHFNSDSAVRSLFSWLHWSAWWYMGRIENLSGWLQLVANELPKPLFMPFMTGYGITQPLLPAAVADQAPWPWKAINLFLSVGWYALLPFLAASLLAVWKKPEKGERRAWICLWVITWIWILLSSFRAGGSQWDNPRYRSWFLVWQAFLAAEALAWWRESHSPWMGRILAVEAVFLVFFGIWYSSRYGTWAAKPLHVFVVLAAVVLASGLILIGGGIRDRLIKYKKNRT